MISQQMDRISRECVSVTNDLSLKRVLFVPIIPHENMGGFIQAVPKLQVLSFKNRLKKLLSNTFFSPVMSLYFHVKMFPHLSAGVLGELTEITSEDIFVPSPPGGTEA